LLVFWLLPFILYLFYRSRKEAINSNRYIIILVLTLLATPFWHPTDGGLFLAGIFLVMGFALWLRERFAKSRDQLPATTALIKPGELVNPALIVAVVWLAWFSATWMFSRYVISLRDALFLGWGTTETELYLNWFSRAAIPLSDALLVSLKRQGEQLPYLLTAGIISLITWWRVIFTRKKVAPNHAIFSLLFIASAIAILLLAFIPVPFEFTRLIPYAILPATVLCGLGLYDLLQNLRRQTLIAAIIIVIAGFTTAQGVLNTYPSPFTLGANSYVTLADIAATEWLLKKQDENLLIEDVVMNQYNLAGSINGRQGVPGNFRIWWNTEAPDHFGYDEYDTFGEAYRDDAYFLSHDMARVYYTERLQGYPTGWRWTPADFARLETDPSVSRIYNNGGFEIFYIAGAAGK